MPQKVKVERPARPTRRAIDTKPKPQRAKVERPARRVTPSRRAQHAVKVAKVALRQPVKDLKVLIYCPMFPGELKVHPQTLQSILGLDWCIPHEIVFGKNDQSQPETIDDKHGDIARKYNQARELVLQGGYDALLTVEADMVLPADTLHRLTSVDADVAYGLYVSRHNKNWYLYTDGPVPRHQASRDPEFRRAAWGNVVESVGIGTGCTLIHRKVLEALNFEIKPGAAHDWHFAKACQEKGFRQAHDCGLICGHINGDQILWPDPTKTIRSENLK